MWLKINQTLSQHGHLFFLFNLHPPPPPTDLSPKLIQVLKISIVQHSFINMPPRSLKNKTATEKGVTGPVTMAHGRQRTQSTKQQLLGRCHMLLTTSSSGYLLNTLISRPRKGK